MKLIFELDGVEVVMHIKAGQQNLVGSSLLPMQNPDFVELLATMLANRWLAEQGLRQAA